MRRQQHQPLRRAIDGAVIAVAGVSAGQAASAPNHRGLAVCYAAFAISGFAGLIYESIWSRYLQTFLGAEAYAQGLVLTLFLGGMAVGAWLTSRRSRNLQRPLLAYAIVELALAALALCFHGLFRAATDWTFSTVIPLLPAPWAMESWKWALATALILPQCLLLGATFPLLAAGAIRGDPQKSGRALGWLYFTNSAGGAVGVLANGFLLVPWIGLPGSVAAAGILNAVAGGLAWAGDRFLIPGSTSRPLSIPRPFPWRRFCLVAAAVTGAASLVYELVWIRLLNLVLGSSSHSFELMLSAFIGGLAIGGFWIRRRADRIVNPVRVLGIIQLAMGALALGTLIFYGELFWAMHWMLQALARTESGYVLFVLGSHLLALVVMLPATICAGMTLPLLTRYQLAEGGGESTIGRTYAANTLGAIVGILATMHVLLPSLGIKGAMLVGAGLDLALGIGLLVCARASKRLAIGAAVFATGLWAALWAMPSFNPQILNSGVFIGGVPKAERESDIVFYRHGKTATVGVVRFTLDDGPTRLGFTTNGKGNGTLWLDAPPDQASPDEPSFGLLGLLPHLVKPNAKQAACIGIGTGLSAHNLLGSPHLLGLDIVELEPATIDAARLFSARTGRVFDDPRVSFHGADARTFFRSRADGRYDVILSQPSNVWMPGVAGLFTEEFYANLRDALAADGVLVQWMQLYSADEQMVLSVLRALGDHFADYRLYLATSADLLVVAAKTGRVPLPQYDAFEWPGQGDIWRRVGVRHELDLALRWAGDRSLVAPAIEAAGVAANSDYRPLLEDRALKAFFLRGGYRAFDYWTNAFGYPLLANLAASDLPAATVPATERRIFRRSFAAAQAGKLAAAVESSAEPTSAADLDLPAFGGLLPFDAWLRMLNQEPCADFAVAGWDRFLPWLVAVAGPNLSQQELRRVWAALNNLACADQLRERDAALHDFVGAALTRDYATMAAIGPALLAEKSPAQRPFVMVATATAFLKLGEKEKVRELFNRLEPPMPPGLLAAMELVFAHAQAVQQNGSAER